MRMFHYMTLAIGVLVTTLALGYVFFSLTPFALADVETSGSSCIHVPDTETHAQGSWEKGVYTIEIEQRENCAVALSGASVQRIGGHLFIRTQFSSPAVSAGCTCRHRSSIRVRGLPEQAFKLHVYSWL